MNKDETPPAKNPQGGSSSHGATRLGPTISIQGEITGSEDLVIEGRFQGKIHLGRGDLLIAQGAKVEAEVSVRNLSLQGELNGTAVAAERVMIAETGQMKGDITAARISITDGAQFKGSIRMGKPDAT